MNDKAQSAVLSTNLSDNLALIRSLLNEPSDLFVKVIKSGDGPASFAVICLSGLSDTGLIHDHIIRPIQQSRLSSEEWMPLRDDNALLDELENKLLAVQIIRRERCLAEIVPFLLTGDTVLIAEGTGQALVISSRSGPERSVEEPQTEALVRGPRVGFTENIQTNVSLIRRMITDPQLSFETYAVGQRSKQTLSVMYINGIIHPDIVNEVKLRLDSIGIDMAPESGTVEQWIEDSFLSPFPQILHTERPDKVVAALFQGKAAILLDGTPFALVLPTTFISLVQSPEDYYERWMIGSLIRLLRYAAILISLFLPAIYIALISFHQGMIPFKLASSIAASREGVPFPAVIEAILMEATLELLREAGIRLPKPIGQTIGIVGGLVIGEAAVQAGVVSPIMVIVVAVTAISSFTIPSYSAGIAFRMLRFATMIASAILGLYGIVLMFIMITIHLLRLYSFGVPYSAPFAPSLRGDWQDLFIRAPITVLTRRPRFMQTRDEDRVDPNGGKR
ncbi:MAG: spore germination protein [Paenibacillus sp.]|uniref:spore germination protein n=1 Tax=Paenibacillus sp. GCM10012303 TaxID=3317340 RepID=UPI0029F1E1FB|nr:spore germination protein [Paenibacillus sp.]